jgi:hypothetical protein
MQITGNHFESSKRHIWQNSFLTCKRLTIENNHLAATVADVIPIELYAANDCVIGKNDFVIANVGTFVKHVVLNRDSTYGNIVEIPFKTANGMPDLSLYTLRDTNTVSCFGGDLNIANTQPTFLPLSGSGNYTAEKYISRHRIISDKIPECTTAKTSTSVTIDTFVDWDVSSGLRQPVLFYLEMAGSLRNYRKTGVIAGTAVTHFQDVELLVSGAPATMTVSNNSGKLRIVISSATSDTYFARGFVKAL